MIIDGIDMNPLLDAYRLAMVSQRGLHHADISLNMFCSGPDHDLIAQVELAVIITEQ